MSEDGWEEHFKLWSTIFLMVAAGLSIWWFLTHSGGG